MKLSQLVRFLNNLDGQSRPDPEQICQRELGELCRIVSETQPNLQQHVAQLLQDRDLVKKSLERFCQDIEDVKQEILTMIAALQPIYFAESYKLHKEMLFDSDELILNRHLMLDTSMENYVRSRIAIYSDWRYAGMILRPGTGKWLPVMVGLDPLYLVDIRNSLLLPATQQFPQEYQRRLRYYLLRENDSNGHILRDLPDSQFGFCLAIDFFHFKPFELIRLYLSEIYSKLKPGGVVAMTFNDCDRWGGVDLAERHFMCYTPGGMLLALCQSIGFEIHQTCAIDNCNTWLEIRKPGTLHSNRGGQSLARIVANH